MKVISNLYKRGNTWYFRKKVNVNFLKDKQSDLDLKLSLKKMLGAFNYNKAILEGNLPKISQYVNNNIDYYLKERKKTTLEDLNDFVLNLLQKYESKAFMSENNYTAEIGTRKRDIEELRFNKIAYFDDNGVKFGGHTPKALNKEIEELEKASDTQNIGLMRKKSYEILQRQDIITQDELSEIELLPDDVRVSFDDALIKKEIEILLQDLNNYNSRYNVKQETSNESDLLQKLYQIPELSNILKNIEKSQKDDFDNWEYLIERFMEHLEEKNKSVRVEKVTIEQFSMMMLGDAELEVPTRTLLLCDDKDITALKPFFLSLPKLTNSELTKWREWGILYTIKYAKKHKLEKLMYSGIRSRLDVVISFLEYIKLVIPKYKDLNLDLWKKFLTISENDLSVEDKIANRDNKKLPFKSEYINGFLLNRYKDVEGKRVGTAERNFTRHTSASPHIFWSVALAIFTGARAGELAQLKVEDVKKSNGIHYLAITDDDLFQQHLKNDASKRKTPICDKLIELGFLNYVKGRKAMRQEFLFDIKKNGDGRRKEFQRSYNVDIKTYLKRAYPELPNYKFSFHDLRAHFVGVFLRDEWENKEKLIQLKKLIGHTADDIHKDITITHYDREEIELTRGKSLIDKMDFNIDAGYDEIKRLTMAKFGDPVLELED